VSTTIERLLIIQERDRTIARLAREAKDLPERKKQLESRLSAHKDSLHKTQEDLKKAQAAIKQLEGDIEAARQKISKFREQQYQIKDNVQFKALDHEISLSQKGIRELEDRELILMEQVEQARSALQARESDLGKEQGRVEAEQKEFDGRLGELQAEIAKLQADRKALTEGLDPKWLSQYDRIFKRSGDYALVPVERGACGGCHMVLPPQLVHDARKGLTMAQCNYCARLLYWKP